MQFFFSRETQKKVMKIWIFLVAFNNLRAIFSRAIRQNKACASERESEEIENKSELWKRVRKKWFGLILQYSHTEWWSVSPRKAISQSAWSRSASTKIFFFWVRSKRERERTFMTFSHWWHRHKLSANRITI